MHLVDVACGFMGATGVVGGNVPIALGSALAARRRGSDAVAVVFFGDGAVQAGHFNETVNLATLWELPLDPRVREQRLRRVHAALGAHEGRARQRRRRAVRRSSARRSTATTSSRCGRRSTASCTAARGGRGPMLLECLTHRLRGHYEGDPAKYREALAKEDWQEKDPVLRLQPPRHRRGLVLRGRRPRRPSARRPRPSRPRSRSRARARSRRPSSSRSSCTRERARRTSRRSTARSHAAMRADERVIVIGEDVAEGGPFTATAGLAEAFGRRTRAQHADQRGGDLRRRRRRRPVGAAAGARDHVRRLPHARARPARQRGGEGARDVGRAAHACRSCCARRAAPASAAPRSTRRASRRG